MGRLDGKVALVSGGARGMGATEARLFVEEGASIVVADIAVDDGEALVDDLGKAAAFVSLDVTSEGSWKDAVAATVDAFGRLDVLVNNAGILRVAPLVMTTADEYMEVIGINQLGVFLGMKSVVSEMQASGGGSIVNISSVAGLTGPAGHVAYAASKWAVRGMTKTAAAELAPLGIRVNSVHPGLIDTAMLDHYKALGADTAAMGSGVPLSRLGTADDVARLVLWLASDDSSYSTGSEFVVDGGMTASPGGRASR